MMPCARPPVVRAMHHSSLAPPSWKIQVQYRAVFSPFLEIVGHGWSQRDQRVLSCANCSWGAVIVHNLRCGGSFPALFLLLAVLGAAMAGAALASLFYRLVNPQPTVQIEVGLSDFK